MATANRSIGFILVKDYATLDQITCFCESKFIDFHTEIISRNTVVKGRFHVHVFSIESLKKLSTFISTVNLNAIVVNQIN